MSPIFPEMRISSARGAAASDARNHRNHLMGGSSSSSSSQSNGSSAGSGGSGASTLIPFLISPAPSTIPMMPTHSSPTNILFVNPNDLMTVSPPNGGTSSAEEPTNSVNDDSLPNMSCWTNDESWFNDPWTSAFCSGLLLLGILFLFYGYRFFKTGNFFMGLVLATSVIYAVCLSEEFLPSWGNYGVSISAGILFGLIMTLVQYVSLFIIGLHLGVLFGVGSIIVLRLYAAAQIEYDINGIPIPWADGHAPQTWPQTIWFVFLLLLGLGLFFACCSLYFQKACTILSTSIYGAGMVVAVIDIYFGNFRLMTWLYELVKEAARTTSMDTANKDDQLTPRILEEELPCLLSWVMISTWPALSVAGVLCQCFMTGKGTHHQMNMYGTSSSLSSSSTTTESTTSRRNGQLDLQKIRQEDIKSEHRQRKYRYLYQVRTAHGDVISQDFIQSLHHSHTNPLHNLSAGKKSLMSGVHDDNSLTASYGPASQYSNTSHLTIVPHESDSRQTTMSHVP